MEPEIIFAKSGSATFFKKNGYIPKKGEIILVIGEKAELSYFVGDGENKVLDCPKVSKKNCIPYRYNLEE